MGVILLAHEATARTRCSTLPVGAKGGVSEWQGGALQPVPQGGMMGLPPHTFQLALNPQRIIQDICV
jgi:hypothetical protein